MIQQGAAIDASSVELRGLDVEKANVADLAAQLKGVDGLVIALGFVPGNPFKMNSAAHAVDNVGTVNLIDAGTWGQLDSAGYKIPNAFGQVLEEKLVAEK